MNAEQTVDNLATHHRQVAFSFLPFAEVWNDDALRRKWDQLIDDTENLMAMYQSPEWLAFLHHSGQVDWGTVALARDAAGNLRGLVPLCAHHGTLGYDVAGHCLYNLPLRQVDLLGGELLLPPEMGVHNHFFLTLDHTFPEAECFLLDSLSCSSFTWRYLQESAVVRRRFLPYAIDGACDYHTLSLPPTFAGYLAQFNRKSVIISSGRYGFCATIARRKSNWCAVDSRADIDLWLTARSCDRPVEVAFFSGTHREKRGRQSRPPHGRPGRSRPVAKLRSQVGRSVLWLHFGMPIPRHLQRLVHHPQPGLRQVFARHLHVVSSNRGPAALSAGEDGELGVGNPRHMFSTQMSAQTSDSHSFSQNAANRFYRASHAALRSTVGFLKRLTRKTP